MQVSLPNDVKVYNLTAGKSVPEWLESRKRRKAIAQDHELQHRIQLLQGFDMPIASTSLRISQNRNYIFAAGTYKPILKCFDVQQLAMKFDRSFDSEIVKFLLLSEDYSKLALLHEDRFIEFHGQGGRYYRLRIPRFGRDLCYNRKNCDLITVGKGPDIYRINLELGRFLQPYTSSDSTGFNTCDVNEFHHLFVAGSEQGTVECWDPRTRKRIGLLKTRQFVDSSELSESPEISCVKFKDALCLSVGTSTGQVMLFDMRSNKPMLVKDHHYGFPINSIEFSSSLDHKLVLSADLKGMKAWHESNGELLTAIEPTDCEINHMCLYPNSGLIFFATETEKMHSYYVPAIGPTPKWCSFLENLTEEMEEEKANVVYDDYKFVTRQELEALDLARHIGTKKLRAYMHGYFVNVQLYLKAKQNSEPFAYEEFKEKKIRENIDQLRHDRVKLDKLPEVNKQTAVRLRKEKETGKSRAKRDAESLLTDERFSKFFMDPEMQIDLNKEDLEVMNPTVLARMVQLQPAMIEASDLLKEAASQGNDSGADDENVRIEGDDSDNDLLNRQEMEAGSSSSEEDDYKKLIKAARKSAELAAHEEQLEEQRGFVAASRTKSRLTDREQDVNEERQAVEMFTNSTGVVNHDFIVPKKAHFSTARFDFEKASLAEQLKKDENLSQKVQSGSNRSQSISFKTQKRPKSSDKSFSRNSSTREGGDS